MKFITTEDETGKQEIFLFPDDVNHDAMAEMLERIKNQTYGNWHRVRRTPIAAGFVDSNLNCYGISESLGLKSRPEDSILLKNHIN